MNQKKLKQTKAQFTLRINKDLRDVLKEQAKQNKRSLNNEIEYLLEKYLIK